MILRPSMADLWGPNRCPAAPFMASQFPEPDSPDALNGNAAHWYLTESLSTGELHAEGDLSPYGVPLDAEMIEFGAEMVADTLMLLAQCTPGTKMEVEKKVFPHGLISPQCEGTADIVIVDYAKHTIYVRDFKYGHRVVNEFENQQLLCYAAGVIESLELTKADLKGWSIQMSIMQPRGYGVGPVRTWSLLGWQIWPYIEALAAAAELALNEQVRTTHTGTHCRDCAARHACPALQATAGICVDIVAQPTPHPLSLDVAARELTLLDDIEQRLKARRTGVEAYVMAAVANGDGVAVGWELSRSYGRPRWTYPVADVIAMASAFGADVRKHDALITPTQARKLGIDGGVIDLYSASLPGEMKLTRVSQEKIRKVF